MEVNRLHGHLRGASYWRDGESYIVLFRGNDTYNAGKAVCGWVLDGRLDFDSDDAETMLDMLEQTTK